MVERLADSRAALAAREAWFRALVQHSSDLLLVVEVDGTVREVASTEAASEWAAERILGHRLQRFLDPAATTALNAVLTAYQQGEAGDGSRLETVEVQLHTAEGEKRTLELLVADLRSEPAVGGLVLTGRDVTDRTQLVAQLAHQALHDQLTGLANRQLFTDRLEQALRRRAARPDDQVALLYIDLDRFKQINDTLGHAAGDRLLQTVAGRLTMMLRGADTAARLGGDEFAILLDGISGLEEASSIAGRLNAALAEPITLNGDVVSPSASIGVAAVSPSSDARTDVLLANADAAMYAAKQKRGRVVAHPPTLPAQRGVAR
jgi:diguanylate cyclase (GGDEF)-like protein/PAS domain S-box-containing protein